MSTWLGSWPWQKRAVLHAGGTAGRHPHDTSISMGSTSSEPIRHVRRVRRSIVTRAEELVVVVGIDVMSLHHPHEMHRIGTAGKAAVSLMDVVADRFRAGDPLRAGSGRASAIRSGRRASPSGATRSGVAPDYWRPTG